MNDQNRLWKLMARKLAGEASKEELEELQELLQKYPDYTFTSDILVNPDKHVEQSQEPGLEQLYDAHMQRMTEKLKEAERHSTLRRQRAQHALWREITTRKNFSDYIVHIVQLLGNYLKIARRSLSRNLTFSIINIAGLAIGIAGVVLLLLLIQFELGFDQFHQKKDRTYELLSNIKINGEPATWFSTPMELAPVIKLNYPEVEDITRNNWVSAFILKYGDKRIQTRGNLVDPGFLNIFSFPLLKGDKKTVLNDPHSIVITESLAKKMFGMDDPIGRIIKIDSMALFTVTGLLKDPPKNTRFMFEYLVPYSYMKEVGWYNTDWGKGSVTSTYVLLKPGVTEAMANNIFRNVITDHASDIKAGVFVNPVRRWHLWSYEHGKIVPGAIQFVRLFSIIAAFILLIACINYMNLSTARSVKRGKEVGIRKVAGAAKSSLVGQFLWESILYSFLATLVALILVEASLGWFNKLLESALAVPYNNPWFWLAGIGFILFTGMIAGSYPAFYLSAYKPIRVLKGIFKGSHALVTPRKVLVVVQFTFAIAFIICTVVIYRQLAFGRHRDVGFDKSNMVFTYNKGDVQKEYPFIRNELLASGAVTDVLRTNAPVMDPWYWEDKYDWKGKDPNIRQEFILYQTDRSFTKTMGLKMVAGRDLDANTYPSDSTAAVVNETAVKVMGFSNPIGQYIKTAQDTYLHIVGVVKDYIPGSPYEPVYPMVLRGPENKVWFGAVTFRLNTQHSTAANMATISSIFRKYNPDYPFEYHFVEESFTLRFQNEEIMGTLAALFAGLTIFISCLGLFALATYMAESRTKEIGIRKVLGASVTTITTLLSRDFLKLVIISFLIASPVAGWLMYHWLQHYEYRIPLSWWIFAGTGIMSVLIALVTVGYQSLKAALANPVKSLRSE